MPVLPPPSNLSSFLRRHWSKAQQAAYLDGSMIRRKSDLGRLQRKGAWVKNPNPLTEEEERRVAKYVERWRGKGVVITPQRVNLARAIARSFTAQPRDRRTMFGLWVKQGNKHWRKDPEVMERLKRGSEKGVARSKVRAEQRRMAKQSGGELRLRYKSWEG